MRTGAPWRDPPERYGPWDKILAEVIVRDDAVGEVEWVISVDSSVVRAQQHAAGARKRGRTATVNALAVEGEGRGRSHGGLGTKIHLAVDRRGRPLRVPLTPGQAGDNSRPPPLDGIRVARVRPGRPRSRPEMVIADKAYSHPATRQALRDRQIRFVSPERDPEIARRAAAMADAHPPATLNSPSGATSSSAASIGSNSSATWLPAPPNESPTTTPSSPSPRSFSGLDELQDTP